MSTESTSSGDRTTEDGSSQRKITRRTALKSIAAGAAASSIGFPYVATRAFGANPIKVGVISPLSGPWTVYGKAHLRGFQLGVKEVNENGGVLGRQIEVVVGDSETKPRVVVEQANRLIRRENVDFLAGTFSSAERNAAGPVVERHNKVLLYPTFYEGQDQEYYPGTCNKNIFMFGPVPSQQVWPHLDYMLGNFGKRIYMIGSDYVWPRVTNKVTKRGLKDYDAEVVAEQYIPFNTPNYESVLRDIQDKDPDIIFHSLTGSDTVNFRKQFASAGLKDDYVLWTVDDEESVTRGLGPEISKNDYVSFDYFMSIDHPNNKGFLKKVNQEHGEGTLMNTVGVAMYNAAHMSALALQKSGEVSTAALREGLKGISFENAPQGTVRMRSVDNQTVLPSYLMKVRPGWTDVYDMFEQIQSFDEVEPLKARCENLPL